MFSTRSGLPKKRLFLSGTEAARWVGAYAEAAGVEVVTDPSTADVVVTEANTAEDVRSAPGNRVRQPLLAVSSRRLRDAELRDFFQAGANRVVHGASSVLDLAVALADLLFASSVEQRRYGRKIGGLPVRVVGPDETSGRGRLVGIARSGGIVITPKRVPEGSSVRLEIEVGSDRPALRGRVAYATEERLGVEFALEQAEVASPFSKLGAKLPA